MKLLHIDANNYRNYQSINLDIDDGKYYIIKANNGSGKTNLIELIYYFTYFKSFRNTADSDLIMHGSKQFQIGITYEDDGLTNEMKIIYDGQKKKVFLNDKKTNKTSDLFSRFVSIIFSASDIDIITGTPNIRRNFFNMFFSIIDISYFNEIKNYNAVLKQKNYILKTKQNIKLLDVYNKQLSQMIYTITQIRQKHINEVKNRFTEKYDILGEFDKKTDLRYIPSISADKNAEQIYDTLCQKRDDELRLGYALYGIHRDNYYFYMNDKLFSKYASFGQCRLAALIIKMIQAEYTADIKHSMPVLLFDDVILELDETRKRKIVNSIRNYNQMFITFTEDIFVDLFEEKPLIRTLDISGDDTHFMRR